MNDRHDPPASSLEGVGEKECEREREEEEEDLPEQLLSFMSCDAGAEAGHAGRENTCLPAVLPGRRDAPATNHCSPGHGKNAPHSSGVPMMQHEPTSSARTEQQLKRLLKTPLTQTNTGNSPSGSSEECKELESVHVKLLPAAQCHFSSARSPLSPLYLCMLAALRPPSERKRAREGAPNTDAFLLLLLLLLLFFFLLRSHSKQQQ